MLQVDYIERTQQKERSMKTQELDAAQVGKMFVTQVNFQWIEGGQKYNNDTGKYDKYNGHWNISATLSDKPSRYSNDQSMSFHVEQGIGAKIVEILLPVVVADASRKAQQLADDSKAMLTALGERCQQCIADANMSAPAE